MDITNRNGVVNDPSHARVLILKNDQTTLVIVSVDVVAFENIGPIQHPYIPTVRAAVEKELGIKGANILFNASHCHSSTASDSDQRTIKAIKQAAANLVPVKIGVGVGHEDRIQENRRIILKSGKQFDSRRAYSMPIDDEVAGVGPIDPQIGILRVDKMNGDTLAVVYQFACHPIQGVPNGGNTADMTGFSSKVIEENLSPGTVALFLQGCGGDINPIHYKQVDKPTDAEPLGNMLALSTLKTVRKIKTAATDDIKLINEQLTLPRADYADRIEQMLSEQRVLLKSLRGTFLNLDSFLPLAVKYKLSEFPSYYSHGYLHEKKLGRSTLEKLDASNRRNIDAYIRNIITMEKLTRLQTNLVLLQRHQQTMVASGKRTIDVELVGMKVGDFVLVTSPGELTVQVGLNIKKRSPHKHTFVSGYTNGYIYYAPTAEQLKNVGWAQEDSDCLLAPEWHKVFDDRVDALLKKL
ncbi:MAG: hypothetical protein CMJ78_14120 [Planctomycetaceae bacterium]|nr:hypothetical protein [Planctomycetaceae bacterium]